MAEFGQNSQLWRDHPVAPPAGSPIRSRLFWWHHFALGEMGHRTDLPLGPDQRPFGSRINLYEDHQLAMSVGGDDRLMFRSGSHGSSVSLRRFMVPGPGLLGYYDDAHSMPDVFRWSEVGAIARYLETERGFPTEPRLALLLLAPFAAVTEEEDGDSIVEELRDELSRLGVLDPAEVEVAASTVLVRPRPWATDGEMARWVSDAVVGWRLDGESVIGEVRMALAHSLRRASETEFPAELLVDLIHRVGAAD